MVVFGDLMAENTGLAMHKISYTAILASQYGNVRAENGDNSSSLILQQRQT